MSFEGLTGGKLSLALRIAPSYNVSAGLRGEEQDW
jgi:hypothetical protein